MYKRERERERKKKQKGNKVFFEKMNSRQKQNTKIKKKSLLTGHRDRVHCCPINLVMSQLYQMITKHEMSIITYVHTTRKETITIQSVLEHVPSLTEKSTTSNGTSSSYVKCGPRISKVLRLKKMMLKKMTLK